AAAMPSMVRMSAPCACTANMVQDFTDLPSRSTVQAPQWVVSQPICAPVRLSCSRSMWTSSVRGSTSTSTALPFTVMATWVLAIGSSPSSGATGALAGACQRARQHHAGHLLAIGDGPAGVGGGRGDRLRRFGGSLHGRGIELRAHDNGGGVFGPQRRLGQVGEADRAARDACAAHGENNGCGCSGVVADLAFELFVGRSVARGGYRDAHGGEHLAGLHRRGIGALIEFPRRNAT